MRVRPFALVLPLVLCAATLGLGQEDKDVYLEGTEKVEVKEPAVRVVRPSRDWVFINLDALNKKQPQGANPNLKARLLQGGANANFYVIAWPDERADTSSEKVGAEQLEATRNFFKDKGKVLQNGATRASKLDAWGLEVEGTPASGGDPLVVSKVVVYRAADKQVFILSLEVPKKTVDLVKKDKAKLFSGVQLQ
jgi:hypothetical protein